MERKLQKKQLKILQIIKQHWTNYFILPRRCIIIISVIIVIIIIRYICSPVRFEMLLKYVKNLWGLDQIDKMDSISFRNNE